MDRSFVDTSALLKLYVEEVGSRWMKEEVYTVGIGISGVAVPEVGATLARRVREGSLEQRQAQIAWKSFRRDLRSFLVIDLDRRLMNQTFRLANRSLIALRALDALQLQCALDLAAVARRRRRPIPLFISADARLLDAAAALGFAIDSPLNHP